MNLLLKNFVYLDIIYIIVILFLSLPKICTHRVITVIFDLFFYQNMFYYFKFTQFYLSIFLYTQTTLNHHRELN